MTDRQRLKAEYPELFDKVAALLFRHDPMSLNFGDNTDEYEPEVCAILPRLRSCHSAEEVRRVVHQEFTRCFDADTAGPEHYYDEIAKEIWELWQKFNAV
jgi:hypothetical protein